MKHEDSSWCCYQLSLYQRPTSRGQSNYLLVTFGVFVANEALRLCYGRALQCLGSFGTRQLLCKAPWPSHSKLLACSQLRRKGSDGQCAWFLPLSLFQSGKYLICFLAVCLLEQSSNPLKWTSQEIDTVNVESLCFAQVWCLKLKVLLTDQWSN